MIKGIEYNQWAAYFRGFNLRNRWRPTRLEVLSEAGARETERGMPLVGISLESDFEGSPRIHIMLGNHDAIDPRHQTFTITGVRRVTPRGGINGLDEALLIEDEQGEKNLLCFEPLPSVCQIR
jgi:hypothetical protein